MDTEQIVKLSRNKFYQIKSDFVIKSFINLLYYSDVYWKCPETAIAASHSAVADFTVVYTKWSSDKIGVYNDFRFLYIFVYCYISKYCSYELSIHQS